MSSSASITISVKFLGWGSFLDPVLDSSLIFAVAMLLGYLREMSSIFVLIGSEWEFKKKVNKADVAQYSRKRCWVANRVSPRRFLAARECRLTRHWAGWF